MDWIVEVINKVMSHAKFQRGSFASLLHLNESIPHKLAKFHPEDSIRSQIFADGCITDAGVAVSFQIEKFSGTNPKEIYKYSENIADKSALKVGIYRELLIDHLNQLKDLQGFNVLLLDQKTLFDNAFLLQNSNAREILNDVAKQDKKLKPNVEETIIQAWSIFFYVYTHLRPIENAFMMALLYQKLFLNIQGADAGGSLFLGVGFMKHQTRFTQLMPSVYAFSSSRIQAESLLAIVNFVIEIHEDTLQTLNLRLKKHYQDKLEYDDLLPRQKNMVNFFFDVGYRLEAPKVSSINRRQQDIINHIYAYHSASTKDLSLLHKVNRKTIQRDINELLFFNLIRPIGKGSSLRYTIPVFSQQNSKLKKYQNISLGQPERLVYPVQEAAGIETKKPAESLQQALF